MDEAVQEALNDIRYHQDQISGITVYAINPRGEHYVGYVYDEQHPVPHYDVAVDGDEKPARKAAHNLTDRLR